MEHIVMKNKGFIRNRQFPQQKTSFLSKKIVTKYERATFLSNLHLTFSVLFRKLLKRLGIRR